MLNYKCKELPKDLKSSRELEEDLPLRVTRVEEDPTR